MRLGKHGCALLGYVVIASIAASNQPCWSAEQSEQGAPNKKPNRLSRIFKGVASYYGRKFHGKKTASGKPFDMNAFTCAHPSLPFGTPVMVQNQENGAQCQVIVTDRGPYVGNRCIDLSKAAARKIGITGVAKVVCKTGKYIAGGFSGNKAPRQVASE